MAPQFMRRTQGARTIWRGNSAGAMLLRMFLVPVAVAAFAMQAQSEVKVGAWTVGMGQGHFVLSTTSADGWLSFECDTGGQEPGASLVRGIIKKQSKEKFLQREVSFRARAGKLEIDDVFDTVSGGEIVFAHHYASTEEGRKRWAEWVRMLKAAASIELFSSELGVSAKFSLRGAHDAFKGIEECG